MFPRLSNFVFFVSTNNSQTWTFSTSYDSLMYQLSVVNKFKFILIKLVNYINSRKQ